MWILVINFVNGSFDPYLVYSCAVIKGETALKASIIQIRAGVGILAIAPDNRAIDKPPYTDTMRTD